ncbi:hypothetical protein DENSPDRAFT_882158 [Dentipellis sp. KUC8613]|nr:hypothetical protein DENSPDRAFT_882158 [Dentipellis sp. KUC8613]
MTTTTLSPILVVGSGPAGLIAALTLRKNNVPVRIIERLESFNAGVRGPGIQPRTQELLRFLGVLPDIEAVATKAHQIAKHGKGKEILAEIKWAEYADESPATPYRSVSDVNQSAFEGIVRDHLAKLGTTVETGVELVGITQTEDKVSVTLSKGGKETVEEYDYVISADGAKGTSSTPIFRRTRRMLGISYVGETKEEDVMLLANVECTDIDREHWHTWGEFGQRLFALKPIRPAPLFQIQALGPQLPKTLPHDTAGVQALLDDISGSDEIKLANVSCASEWRANIRMAEKFSVGRVFLAGDCAHCHSPAGAQGANTGMQDAANIAWKLALVHKRLAQPSLLATYEAERQPVVAEMLDLTSQLHRHTFAPHASQSALTPGRAEAPRAGDPYWRPKRGLQLGINCRWSPIVLDARDGAPASGAEEKGAEGKDVEGEDAEGKGAESKGNAYGIAGDHLRAGDRAPQAPGLVYMDSGRGTTLFDMLAGCARHVVLAFAGAAGAVDAAPLAGLVARGLAAVAVLVVREAERGPACVTVGEGMRVALVEDRAGHAYAAYEVERDVRVPVWVVIRPDGMVGAYVTDVEMVKRYFERFVVPV